MQTVEEALNRLRRSKFRSRFHLSRRDVEYIKERGLDVIRNHARDFISARLAPAIIPNDGHQTPMRGHPVFIAQHACACCCRGCLERWYRVPRGVKLSADRQERIVRLLMAWIESELSSADTPAEKRSKYE